VPILGDDTLDSLIARTHATEHELLVATLADLCQPPLPTHSPSPTPTHQRS
jgi:folate-dependent phosphoribosylglycinamide formyltransferase PurN